MGRERAMELAFRQATNGDIARMLEAEFPAAPQDPKDRGEEARALVVQMGSELDVQRLRGQHHIVQRLWEIADSTSREAVTATTWLAREVLGHNATMDKRVAQLAKMFRGYTASQLQEVVDGLMAKIGRPENVLTLEGAK